MDFRGSFLLLTMALIAFSGAKSILAQEHETQPEIEGTGRKTSVLSTDKPNENLNTLKERVKASFAQHESLIHKLVSQRSSNGKVVSGGAADDIDRNTATGEVPKVLAVNEMIPHNTGQGNQENVTSKAKLTGHQIISPESHWNHDHISGRGGAHTYSQPPEVTAMLAGIFVAFAVIGYFGLVCWRRALERKYGNREMLVDEEEFISDE